MDSAVGRTDAQHHPEDMYLIGQGGGDDDDDHEREAGGQAGEGGGGANVANGQHSYGGVSRDGSSLLGGDGNPGDGVGASPVKRQRIEGLAEAAGGLNR